MAPAVVLLTTMSMFYGGTFMVLNPIIVRDIYGGDAAMISSSFAAFMGGTISMTVLLVSMGGLERPGRGLLTAIVDTFRNFSVLPALAKVIADENLSIVPNC